MKWLLFILFLLTPSISEAAWYSPTLRWQDNSNDEAGFVIERADYVTNQSPNWQEIGTVGSNVTLFTDLTAKSGKWYHWRVRSFKLLASGERLYDTGVFRTDQTATLCQDFGYPMLFPACETDPTKLWRTWIGPVKSLPQLAIGCNPNAEIDNFPWAPGN